MHLLLLPGLDGCGLLFQPLLRSLPPHLNPKVVAYPVDVPLGYVDLLPIVERAAVELDDYVVVGESFSGPLALMLAARNPKGLRGVVLCASFIRSPVRSGRLLAPFVRGWMFRWPPRAILHWFLLNGGSDPEVAELLRQSLERVSPNVIAARVRSVLTVDAAAELQACNVPVMYSRAARDRVVRRRCSRLIQRIRPDVRLVEVDGPHLILQATPEECAAALGDFCRSAGAG